MSPQDDSSQLEAELLRVMVRPSVPPQLGLRIMAHIRAQAWLPVPAAVQPPQPGKPWLPGRWGLVACAGAALLLIVLALPREPVQTEVPAGDLAGVERELAEALQLAGSQWKRAQASAFPAGQGNPDD